MAATVIRALENETATLPVSVAEFKASQRVDHSDDDAAIGRLLLAAAQYLDGPKGILGGCMVKQRWAEDFESFGGHCGIRLALFPLIEVEAVKYYDADGAQQTLDPAAYEVTAAEYFGEITPLDPWPSVDVRRRRPVTVEYSAGYGETPESVPANLRAAIILHAATMYEAGDALTPGAISVTPLGYSDLVNQFRRPSV